MRKLAYGAVWLLILSVPFEKTIMIPGIGTISRLLGIVAVGVGMLALARAQRIRSSRVAVAFLYMFVLWGGLSVFWSLDASLSLQRFITLLQLAVMAWLIWEYGNTEGSLTGFMRAYIYGAWVASIGTIISYLLDVSSYFQRYVLRGFDPNDLGVTLALGISIAMYLMGTEHSRADRWTHGLYIAVSLFAILLTGSRGALLTALVALVFGVFGYTNMSWSKKFVFAFGLALATIPVIPFLPARILVRLRGLPTELAVGTLSGRLEIWEAGLQAFYDRPLLGAGMGIFPEAIDPYFPTKKVAHNAFLSVLVELGLVGLLLFAGIMVSSLILSEYAKSPYRSLVRGLLATWVVGVSSLSWEYEKATWFVLGLIASLAAGTRLVDSKRRVALHPKHPTRESEKTVRAN